MHKAQFEKIHLLLNQENFSQAQNLIMPILADEPENIDALYLLAEIHLNLDRYKEAHETISQCISLDPEESAYFNTQARIFMSQENFREAESSLKTALEINPIDALNRAILAHVKLVRKSYQEALELADAALELDPENILALNTRGAALLKLNRKEEAQESIEDALREDPINSFSHSNNGWGKLEQGKHKEALEHFKEALQIDPNNDYAQAGLLEAIKAKSPIYRLFMAYFFFMNKLTAKYQWGVIIGFYIAFRGIRALADSNEALEPYLTPVLVIFAILAFSTWIIPAISNAFLRFNKFGKYLLDEDEKKSANFVAGSLAISILGFIGYAFTQNEFYLGVAIFGFAMILPYNLMFAKTKKPKVLLIYAIAMTALGIGALAQAYSSGQLMNTLSSIFVLAFVAYQWVANYMMIDEGDR